MVVFLESVFDLDKKVFRTNFVCRNFNVGNRVIQYFKGKFYHGVVVEKITYKGRPWKNPYLLIKTDEKVGKEEDDLLKGYGLRGPSYGRYPTLFEDETLPDGDEIYKKMFERPMTKAEIKRERKEQNKPLPF